MSEWRVFSVSSSNSLPGEIWPLIGLSPSKEEPERTDVYLTCTPGAGLKLRDGKEIEVKLRRAVADGEAEAWEKVVRTKLPSDINSQDPAAVGEIFRQNLLKIQPKIGDPGLKDSLESALAALGSPQQFVSVSKTRIKTWAFRLGVGSVEETIVTVKEVPGGLWRTINVESSKPKDIDKLLAMKVTPKGLGGTKTSLREYLLASGSNLEAYPEFILQRVAQAT